MFKARKKHIYISIIVIISSSIIFFIASKKASSKIISIYTKRESPIITDRNDEIINLKLNPLGYFAEYSTTIPKELKKILLKKEDRYFYYHPGINPFSILRAGKNYLTENKNIASSTITQQLVKILLSNENKRTIKNKLIELFYAVSLESHLSKDDILKMYCNSIFLGNNTQGFKSASRLYFDKEPENLDEQEIISLIASISSPTNTNPFEQKNYEATKNLSSILNINNFDINKISPDKIKSLKSNFNDYYNKKSSLEINSLNLNCATHCKTTIDQPLNNNLRDILKINLQSLIKKDALNGALIVIKIPENDVLAIVGSPDPEINSYGYKINMATKPRPIGSTIKPFIYLKGFEKNLRPYSFVEDKEYKYTIGTGFAFYPKNYDYAYRGKVTLHYALSNSLNVPTVKVLEYCGLENFYNFLLADLNFSPAQNLENYQLGIALGELEMDLMRLSHYFTIFPNEGNLNPLKITGNNLTNFSQNKKISEKPYTELINKILSDRATGVEQFGAKSNLNLYTKNYAVKTGTSRDYHDSWTIGYTPDFLIGAWVGNSDDTPMQKISGQNGAGEIWNEAMNLLINSKYNKYSNFNFNHIKEFHTDTGIVYGLKNDDFSKYQNLLIEETLITSPHNNDTFLYETGVQIPIKASAESNFFINEELKESNNKEIIFTPPKAGGYEIKVSSKDNEETITIFLEEPDFDN